jgi:hypothetical protein
MSNDALQVIHHTQVYEAGTSGDMLSLEIGWKDPSFAMICKYQNKK